MRRSGWAIRLVSLFSVIVCAHALTDAMTIVTLIVDIGSSNTWVGANASNPYIPTNTSTSTDTIIVSVARLRWDFY